jgi:hypothetical protein
MQQQIPSRTMPAERQNRPGRSRPLTAVQESLFFVLLFAVGLCLQLAALLLQAGASG